MLDGKVHIFYIIYIKQEMGWAYWLQIHKHTQRTEKFKETDIIWPAPCLPLWGEKCYCKKKKISN